MDTRRVAQYFNYPRSLPMFTWINVDLEKQGSIGFSPDLIAHEFFHGIGLLHTFEADCG